MFTKGKDMYRLVLLLLALIVTDNSFASCPDSVKKNFQYSESPAGSCVYVVNSMDTSATNYFEGDLIWLKADGSKLRAGSAPKDFVAMDLGTLSIYESGKSSSLVYWDSSAESEKTCVDNISLRSIKSGQVMITKLKDQGFTISSGITTKTYFADCRDSGDLRVYADLTEADRNTLEKYSPYGHLSNDLTDPKTNATLPDILGRDELVDKMIARVGSSGDKRSLLLWGPAGVGKTAVVYALASKILRARQGKMRPGETPVPEWLKEWSVYVIDLGGFSSIDGLAGASEGRMREVVKAASGKKAILLMDEIHQLIGIGTAKDDPIDVTEIMKTNLANGQLAVIGTLTDQKNEMSLLQTKKAFYSRFTRLFVEDPNDDVLRIIYKHKAKKLKRSKGVEFTDQIVDEVIKMTRKYVPAEHHPRIGLTLMEDILAAELSPKNLDPDSKDILTITESQLQKAIGEYANIKSLQDSTNSGSGKQVSFEELVFNFKDEVQKKYIGNESAIGSVENELFNAAAKSDTDKRPAGLFFFIGPSGVGKSYLAKLTADYLNRSQKLFPMSSYGDEADVNSFVGAPDGYVGYNKAGGELIRWINQYPDSVLIFDEIDKAHPKVLEAFMINLMEEGWVKSKSGAEASCSQCFIFYTSNYGMKMINAFDVHRKAGVNPPKGDWDGMDIPVDQVPKTESELKDKILNDLINSQEMGSYFQGRLNADNIVIFHHLTKDEGSKIAKLEIKQVVKKYDYQVDVSKAVIDYISDQGLDFRFGARSMRNLAESLLKNPINRKVVLERLKAKKQNKSFKVDKVKVDLGTVKTGKFHPEIIVTVELK